MRILIVGPDHPQGSLPPYLDVLAAALRRHGAHVDRLGSAGVPYDDATGRFRAAPDIVAAVDALADQVDPGGYDLLSVHFGNLEPEQLLLHRWRRRGAALPPAVMHVHALDWTLFTTHVPDPGLRAAVDADVTAAAGLVFFGGYARTTLTARLPATATVPAIVAPLPSTIPPGTTPHLPARLGAALEHRPGATVVSLYGYAAPWKSVSGLLTALRHTTTPLHVVLAGPFWDDPAQAGADLTGAVGRRLPLGAAELTVVPDYLGPAARAALVTASAAGIFAYQPQPTFQGSGAIGDYLAHGVPVIATDVANMAELAGTAGAVVPAGEPAAFAAALDRFAADPRHRSAAVAAARARAGVFTADGHAQRCLELYQSVIHATAGQPQ